MTENETTVLNDVDDPHTWDPDAWLDDAERPMRSVTIYGRADLMAQIDELNDAMRVEEQLLEEQEHRSAADGAKLNELQKQFIEVYEAYQASGRKIRVKALLAPEIQAIRDQATEDKAGEDETSLRLLHAAIVAPEMSIEQVRKMRGKIGDGQTLALVHAYNQASLAKPEVAVPFSRPSSTPNAGPSS